MSETDLVGTQNLVAPGLGFGLTHIADYAPTSPFLDVFKTSRPLFGHATGQWGGMDHDDLVASGVLDADGWPVEIPAGADSIGTVILTEFPTEMVDAAGRYRVTWEGNGEVEIGLSARDVIYGENEAWFSYTPDGNSMVRIDITATDPLGTGDNVRNISVVQEKHIAAYEAGEIFNPVWQDIIGGAHTLRFMDWMDTNNSTLSTPQDAPLVTDATWADVGAPLEVMIRLANDTQIDPWFTLPHLATDAYMRAFISEVRATLDPTLTPYFEFSNEVWNWQFDQAQASHTEGQVRFAGVSSAWVQTYAEDTVRMAEIIDDIYGADSTDAITVISTQTGWRGLEDVILNAPDWVAEASGRNAPSTYADVYAITGYFDGGLGQDAKAQTVLGWIADSLLQAENAADARNLSGSTRADYIETHRYDQANALALQELRDGSVTGNPQGSLAELADLFAYHKIQADAADLELVMYEGGSHIVGIGQWQSNATLTDFFTHLNYSAEMGILYEELFNHWIDAGGTLFNAFTAVDRASQYGSWGHLRHLNDSNPRMDAVEAFLSAYPATQGTSQTQQTGTDAAPAIFGTDGDDLLLGSAGDDRLTASSGNDQLNGDAGWDIVEYASDQENYSLTLNTSGITVTDRSGGTGTDQLTSIEELGFAGSTLNLAQISGGTRLTPTDMTKLIELYIAYYDRAPDAIGLNFWATAQADGMSLEEIAALFNEQPETQALYSQTASTADFVTAVYTNVLGRGPDAEGRDFWQETLDTETVSRAQFIMSLLGGAEAAPPTGASDDFAAQQAADRAHLMQKTEIGAQYAVHHGLSDVVQAEAVMALFDGTDAGFSNALNLADNLLAAAQDQASPAFLMPLVGVLDLVDGL